MGAITWKVFYLSCSNLLCMLLISSSWTSLIMARKKIKMADLDFMSKIYPCGRNNFKFNIGGGLLSSVLLFFNSAAFYFDWNLWKKHTVWFIQFRTSSSTRFELSLIMLIYNLKIFVVKVRVKQCYQRDIPSCSHWWLQLWCKKIFWYIFTSLCFTW